MEHFKSIYMPLSPATQKISHVVKSCIILLPTIIAGLIMMATNSELGDVIFTSIADAYIQVSAFVAGTFFIFYGIEKFLKIDASSVLQKDTIWQVPIAAALGALPGCGGAIIVVTQYVTGRLSFGSVVAVLTATMGDAAFLLIAQEPLTGMAIISMGFVAGTISGWLINALHGQDFLRSASVAVNNSPYRMDDASTPWVDRFWLMIMMPGLIFAILVAFQIDVNGLFKSLGMERPATLIGVVGGVLALSMRLMQLIGLSHDNAFSETGSILRRTIANTNFVTTWVVLAFLTFELSVYIFELDLKSLFTGVALYTPAIAILIGFLPGCGPQVLVTTMYLSGFVPLSAQIGNAISNDGDALFPAIAIAPRVAVLATLYSAVPAALISYSWLFFFELQ